MGVVFHVNRGLMAHNLALLSCRTFAQANESCMGSVNNQGVIEARITKRIFHSVVHSSTKDILPFPQPKCRNVNEASSTLQPENFHENDRVFLRFHFHPGFFLPFNRVTQRKRVMASNNHSGAIPSLKDFNLNFNLLIFSLGVV